MKANGQAKPHRHVEIPEVVTRPGLRLLLFSGAKAEKDDSGLIHRPFATMRLRDPQIELILCYMRSLLLRKRGPPAASCMVLSMCRIHMQGSCST